DSTPVAWAGEGSEEMPTTVSTTRDEPPRGQGAVGHAVRTRRAAIDNELSLRNFGGPRREAMLNLGYHSLIALPLFEGDAVVGTLSLCAKEPGFFDADEVALLTELAGNVSFALDHMARQQKLDKLSRIRAVSSEINAAIVRSRNRNLLFDEVCRIAVRYGNFGIAWVGLYDPGAGTVTPTAWGGTDDPEQIRKFVAIVRTEHSLGKGELIRAILKK